MRDARGMPSVTCYTCSLMCLIGDVQIVPKSNVKQNLCEL